MKIRNGFVSNSSSSSFVVKYRIFSNESKDSYQKVLLTDEQRKALIDFGFKYTKSTNPYFVNTKLYPYKKTLKSFHKFEDVCLGYTISCNQDDVISFLVKNKIPFVALCHYDQEIVAWDGKNENFYEMSNPIESLVSGNGTQTFDTDEQSQYYPHQMCPKIRKYKIES